MDRGTRRRLPTLLVLLSVVLPLALTSCRPVSRPNVVLIVVDTLRRDTVSGFGYERATTPNLDALMTESVVYEDLVNASSQTVPVVASLMTGLYPSETGIHYYSKKSSFDGERTWNEAGPNASPSLDFLSEELASIGYDTAAVVTNPWIREEFGFGQGFSHFVPIDCGDRCDGKDVVTSGLDWLASRGADAPFFLYLHFMDVHNPYRKPGITKGRYTSASREDLYRNGPTPEMEPGHLEYLRDLYDEGVHYVDAQIGSFLAALDPSNTIVVVVADHGDEFDEHGGLGHGTTLYEELVAGFAIVHFPDRVAPDRVTTPVSTTDIAPTILSLVRNEPTEVAVERALYSELGSIKSVRRGDWKLILDIEEGEPRLFHLPTDPAEATNVAKMNPRVTKELMTTLSRFVANATPPADAGAARPMDAELVEKLRALGYVQ